MQKGYFGRQRLQALTKGLRTQRHVKASGQSHPTDKACEIDLAHAKRDMRLSTVIPATPQNKSFIPKQSLSGSRTNRSSASGSSRTRSSKVLAALDTSERMWIYNCLVQQWLLTPPLVAISMRAEINRILSVPDFAGLTQRHYVPFDSRSLALKRRKEDFYESPRAKVRKFYASVTQLSTLVALQRPRYSESSIPPDSSGLNPQINIHVDAPLSDDQGSALLSPFKTYPWSDSDHPIQELSPFVPDNVTTHSKIADDFRVIRQSSIADNRQNYGDEELGTMQVGTTNSDDDSGYAEFSAELKTWDSPLEQDAIIIQEKYIPDETYTRVSTSHSRSLYQRSSSILPLDTSPPSSSDRFEITTKANHSQISSSSSLESYLPDFSAMAPQSLNPHFRPMAPFAFRTRSIIGRLDNPECANEDVPPSSAAEPPPPTFCLPSPKHGVLVSMSSSSQAAISQESVSLHSPTLLPIPSERDSDFMIKTNLLDEADPWDAIGRLLNLKKPSGSTTQLRSPTRTFHGATNHLCMLMNDRSGVGYIPPVQPDGFAREARIASDFRERTLMEQHTDHSDARPHVQPLRTTNAIDSSETSVSLFLASMLSAGPNNQGGLVAHVETAPVVEESLGALPTALPTSLDDNFHGSEAGVHPCSSKSAPILAASPSLSISASAQKEEIPTEVPNFQGPCLFFDSDEDE